MRSLILKKQPFAETIKCKDRSGDPLCTVYSDGEIEITARILTVAEVKQIALIQENFWLFYDNIT